MNIYNDLLTWIKQTLLDTVPEARAFDMGRIVVEPTKDAQHGDVSTNVAMVMAKPLGMNPRQLGEKLLPALQTNNDVAAISVAGPGFINMTFTVDYWHKQLGQILTLADQFGKPVAVDASKILVEFVSVNPTGPLHAGHGRNAVLGDTIASLLKFYGHDVTREYYVNDAGGQVDALSRSVYLRYGEALGVAIADDAFTADMYGGDYLVPAGQELAARFGDQYLSKPESEWLEIFKDAAVELMMVKIKEDLTAAGVVMDVYTSEKALARAGLIDQMLETLTKTDDAYIGVLAPPKGMIVEDWEERPQTLFRSTKHGDDVDRPLKKSNGGWTYFAGDAAYHFDKYRRGFSQMINVFGADHAGYLKRLMAVVAAMTNSQAHLEIKVTQMVNFMDNGVPIRMSKRAGTFITFRDVVDRVGVDAARYIMVSRHQDTPLDFDFAAVIAQTKDNPIFYINYAHARIHSVLRHMTTVHSDFKPGQLTSAVLNHLTDESEVAMIKMLATWPRVIEMAVQCREPHRLANALYDIAGAFHGLWNKGKDNTHLRFIDPDDRVTTEARLALIWAVATTLKTGLGILGINAVKEMRQ